MSLSYNIKHVAYNKTENIEVIPGSTGICTSSSLYFSLSVACCKYCKCKTE